MNEINNNWITRLEQTGIKKATYAKHLNITSCYLSRLLNGEKTPSTRLMRDINFVLKAYEDTNKIIKELLG